MVKKLIESRSADSNDMLAATHVDLPLLSNICGNSLVDQQARRASYSNSFVYIAPAAKTLGSNLVQERQTKETIVKNLKLFGLATMAAMALMAFVASSASATTLFGGGTELKSGDSIDFSIPSGKSSLMVNTKGEELDQCSTSTIKGKLTTKSSATIEQLTMGNCTFPTTILLAGRIEFHWVGGTNGSVTAAATIEWVIHTVFFGSCVYGVTSGTTIGTISGNPATFTINAVAEKFSGSAFACPETLKWTGTDNSTEPAELHVES